MPHPAIFTIQINSIEAVDYFYEEEPRKKKSVITRISMLTEFPPNKMGSMPTTDTYPSLIKRALALDDSRTIV